MLSMEDLERLIAEKRHEIQREKTQLGLLASPVDVHTTFNDKENTDAVRKVGIESNVVCEHNAKTEVERDSNRTSHEEEKDIPPDLERYIRRYLGLPVMLKAGEYSPNNPLVRGERASGDVLLGLGEYERRRNTLRKIRQQQYREYLDQQAKKKQEAKEQAERERREREEKEREIEEREQEKQRLERERDSPKRRASINVPVTHGFVTKVDSAVQVGITKPLSVAVQTDEPALFSLPSPGKNQLTQAERELSPRCVDYREWPTDNWPTDYDRRRSYGDVEERTSTLRKSNREKLVSNLRHTYMPSIFDADAIQLRNLQAEKEAAERRQFYQQELKNQILEQQRIREERKTREKMLEQAEMRRLEEQLRMLRVAQDTEMDKQNHITNVMKENTKNYEDKRTELQKAIDCEQKLLRTTSQPQKNYGRKNTITSKSENEPSKLPFYYLRNYDTNDNKPFSLNIPDSSIFSPNYDVESYLRRNLNFKDTRFTKNPIDNDLRTASKTESPNKIKTNDVRGVSKTDSPKTGNLNTDYIVKDTEFIKLRNNYGTADDNNLVVKAVVHEPPKDREKGDNIEDALPIPILRHSPQNQKENPGLATNLSDAMKIVDDKWKVPAVQKNILKSLSNDEGKNVSILTQLGSIRRQLQLEQLKLDQMLNKDDKK